MKMAAHASSSGCCMYEVIKHRILYYKNQSLLPYPLPHPYLKAHIPKLKLMIVPKLNVLIPGRCELIVDLSSSMCTNACLVFQYFLGTL